MGGCDTGQLLIAGLSPVRSPSNVLRAVSQTEPPEGVLRLLGGSAPQARSFR